jgi:hypothetical protein
VLHVWTVCREAVAAVAVFVFTIESSEALMGESEHVDVDEVTEDDWEYVVDPAELLPIGDEETFTRAINKMVVDQAPRVFALCEEIGDRVDAAAVAWGMSFQDGHTELVYGHDGPRSRITVVCRTPERARDFFASRSAQSGCTIRLVWVDQAQEHLKTAA